ncbi:TssQ family T6SS-associated lipoprotein [soil metagenome]
MRRLAWWCCCALLVGLTGCELNRPVSITELSSQPAEQALLSGIREYEEASYTDAERDLRRALELRPRSPKDVASANKYLAFITCTTGRSDECAALFTAARQADPAFALTRSEAGHPLWGPVYRRVIEAAPVAAPAAPPKPATR